MNDTIININDSVVYKSNLTEVVVEAKSSTPEDPVNKLLNLMDIEHKLIELMEEGSPMKNIEVVGTYTTTVRVIYVKNGVLVEEEITLKRIKSEEFIPQGALNEVVLQSKLKLMADDLNSQLKDMMPQGAFKMYRFHDRSFLRLGNNYSNVLHIRAEMEVAII